MIERDSRSRVAGDHGKARIEALDQSSKQSRHAGCEVCLRAFAVGEAGIVGRVDNRRIGQELARRRQDGESADAGIDEEDRGVRVHRGSVAWSGRSRKLRRRSSLLPTR